MLYQSDTWSDKKVQTDERMDLMDRRICNDRSEDRIAVALKNRIHLKTMRECLICFCSLER